MKSIVSQLTALSKNSAPSAATFTEVLSVALNAFHHPKPLFQPNELNTVASAVTTSLPLFTSAFRQLDIGMNIDRRQDAQMYRSGLQFIADELIHDEPVHQKIVELVNSEHVKSIEEFIENTVGEEPENVTWADVDIREIQSSHYWWFYSNE